MWSSVVKIAVAFSVGLIATSGGHAQSPAPATKVDLERVGPAIGASLPDFNLHDQHGAARSLKSLLGPQGAVIVFFRSADW